MLILTAVQGQCAQGCLRCSPQSKTTCLYCDLPQGYILQNGKCVQVDPERCTEIDAAGRCLSCDATSYSSPTTGTCVPVPADQLVANCARHGPQLQCLECNNRYYLEPALNLCRRVVREIAQCEVYGRKGKTCEKCKLGYFLAPDGSRCDLNSTPRGCGQASYVGCFNCGAGYMYNPGFRVAATGALSRRAGTEALAQVATSQATDFFNTIYNRRLNSPFVSPCVKIAIPNCLRLRTEKRCAECEDGYFRTKNWQCRKKPLAPIANCIIYRSPTVCRECGNEFFLSNAYRCVPTLAILNCVTYDGTRFSSTCKQCQPTMFVQNNACVNRVNTNIANCQTFAPLADVCQACNTGFVLTTDRLACLAAIANCAAYDTSSSTSATLSCTSCNDTFVLTGNTCVAGTIPSCLRYSSATACVRCLNGFYISSGSCLQSKSIPFCSTFDQTKADTCTSCVNHAFLFTVTKTCLPRAVIPNCVKFSDYATCTECAKGYTLANNQCSLIPPAENCLVKNPSSQCTLCLDGYYLLNGLCVRHYRFLTKDCLSVSDSGVSPSFGCDQCSNYYRSYNFANQAVCISDVELKTTPIDKCVAYDINSSTPTTTTLCKRCAEGFVLSSTRLACLRQCEQSVSATERIPVILETQNGFDSIGPMCGPRNQNDVDSYYLINGAAFIYNCTETAITYHSADVRPLEFSSDAKFTKQFTLGKYRQQVFCDLRPPSTAGLFNLQDVQDPNCSFWAKIGGKYYCQRCAMGRAGVPRIDATTTPASPVNYVTCEVAMQNCDSQVFYGGLDKIQVGNTKLSSIFSCHKCYRNDEIPVAFITDAGVAVPYAKSANAPSSVTNINSPTVECLNPTAHSLGIPENLYLATLPELCGFAAVFTNKQKNFVDLLAAATSVRCLACRPGSRPVREGDVIKACAPIPNCDPINGVDVVNQCSACKPTFNFKVKSTSVVTGGNTVTTYNIDFTSCQRQRDVNARFEDEKGVWMCNQGYTLNYDGVCEKIVPAYCQENFYNSNHAVLRDALPNFVESDYLRQLIVFNPIGCRKCTSNFYLASIVAAPTQTFISCSYSPYTLEGSFIGATTYISNCKNYGDTFCFACESGYVMSVDKKNCVAQDAYPFCDTVDTTARQCTVCRSGYVLVQGQCEKPAIPFCLLYNSDGSSKQICVRCEAQYRLVQNSCIPGEVRNCELFDTMGACVNCLRGFVLTRLKTTQYCMPLSVNLNCAVAKTSLGSPPLLECTECQPNFGLSIPTVQPQICLSLNNVNNCETYSNSNELGSSFFNCTQCKSDYFLHDNGSCMLRTRNTTNCAANKTDGDYCAECNAAYMLSTNKTCRPAPAGILNCEEYLNRTTCKTCAPGTILQANACVLPAAGATVENCFTYFNNGTCSGCVQNFILQDNVCSPAQALNCKTYRSSNVCATCIQGYSLQLPDVTGTVHCFLVSQPNCEKTASIYPYRCMKCLPDFFLSRGKCLAVSVQIKNCVSYKTMTTCGTCMEGFVLSQKGDACVPARRYVGLDNNQCADLRITKQPTCNLCAEGFKF